MEHPGNPELICQLGGIVKEIAAVITSLTKGSPQEQQDAINDYFVPEATFSHPFCRVPSFSTNTLPLLKNVDSRSAILGIYRWYRTLSPRIELTVDSAAFDQRTNILYVSIHQKFAIWFVPFYKAPVKLVTVLKLTQRASWGPNETVAENGIVEGERAAAISGSNHERLRYYITSQDDLYPVNDCIQFLLPGLGPLLWFGWQVFSACLCVLLSTVFFPLYLLLNNKSKAS